MRPSDRGGELQQRKRVALRFVGDVAPDAGRKVGELVAQQLHRVGLQKRGDVELRQAGAFEESAGSRRVAPSSPIRLPPSRRPTNPMTEPVARSSQCMSSTTTSSGVHLRACRMLGEHPTRSAAAGDAAAMSTDVASTTSAAAALAFVPVAGMVRRARV
jgi:hypothetical protein